MMVLEEASSALPADIHDFGGSRILVLRDGGRPASLKTLVNDLISEAWSYHATTIAIPTSCLPIEFFQLRTGVAGAMIQKLVNYRITLAFVGPIPDPLLGSLALRDFIRECNRGRSTWFVDDMDELMQRLSGRNY